MWVSKKYYDDVHLKIGQLNQKVEQLTQEVNATKPKPVKKACIGCGKLTDYIPMFNVKYCSGCEFKIQNTR